MRILVADEDAAPLARAAELVRAAGHEVDGVGCDLPEVGVVLDRRRPELAVIAVHRSAAHALALVEQVNDTAPCPIVLLLEEDDPALIREALDRGVDAFAARATAGALQAAIEFAQRRRSELRGLGGQISGLERGARRRALIEQAKGVVMERHDVDERRAYEMLRAHARDNRTTLAAVAEAVITSRALLRPADPRGRVGDAP